MSLCIRVDQNLRVLSKFGIFNSVDYVPMYPREPKITNKGEIRRPSLKSESAPCIRVGPNFSRFVKIFAFSNSVSFGSYVP